MILGPELGRWTGAPLDVVVVEVGLCPVVKLLGIPHRHAGYILHAPTTLVVQETGRQLDANWTSVHFRREGTRRTWTDNNCPTTVQNDAR